LSVECWVLGVGCWVLGVECLMLGVECLMLSLNGWGVGVEYIGCREKGFLQFGVSLPP
jgi:hypothetical protein